MSSWRILLFLSVSATLASSLHCRSATNVAKGPGASGDLCASASSISAVSLASQTPELRRLLRHDVTRAAARRTVETLFAGYRDRGYDCNEVIGAFASLGHLLASERQSLAVHAATADDPRLPGADDVIVVYLNPTCDVCQRVAQLLISARRKVGDFPAVVFRALPSPDDRSLEAAAALEVIFRTEREAFPQLMVDFVMSLPTNGTSVDSLVPAELSVRSFRESRGYAEAQHAVRARIETDFARDFTAPILIFHNRLIQRDVTFGPGFNPLHDDTSLVTTLDLIRLFDRDRSFSRR
jgi:hypothetical protein